MKKYVALFMIVVMAVSVIGAAGIVTAAPPKPGDQKLKAPELMAPKDRAKFQAGTEILFTWKAVAGATKYTFVLQRQTANGVWEDWSTRSDLTTPSITMQPLSGSGAGTYRWHVQAVASDPALNSKWSGWSTFTVERPKPLEAPKLVTPADHASFTTTSAITFTWKVVDRAVSYVIEMQQQDASGKWQAYRPGTASVTGTTATQTVSAAGTYRWHVQAVASDPALNSKWSGWRTFTVEQGSPPSALETVFSDVHSIPDLSGWRGVMAPNQAITITATLMSIDSDWNLIPVSGQSVYIIDLSGQRHLCTPGSDGAYTWATTTPSAVGDYTYRVVFDGTAEYQASSYDLVLHVRTATAISITASPGFTAPSGTITVTATLMAFNPATGAFDIPLAGETIYPVHAQTAFAPPPETDQNGQTSMDFYFSGDWYFWFPSENRDYAPSQSDTFTVTFT